MAASDRPSGPRCANGRLSQFAADISLAMPSVLLSAPGNENGRRNYAAVDAEPDATPERNSFIEVPRVLAATPLTVPAHRFPLAYLIREQTFRDLPCDLQ